MTESKRPTHSLCMITKESDEKFQQIGVGWQNDKGAISIKLNKGVDINWRDLEDQAIYLFPANKESTDG